MYKRERKKDEKEGGKRAYISRAVGTVVSAMVIYFSSAQGTKLSGSILC